MSREHDDEIARTFLAGNPILAAWLRRDVAAGRTREQILAHVAPHARRVGEPMGGLLDSLIGHTVDMLRAGQQDSE